MDAGELDCDIHVAAAADVGLFLYEPLAIDLDRRVLQAAEFAKGVTKEPVGFEPYSSPYRAAPSAK